MLPGAPCSRCPKTLPSAILPGTGSSHLGSRMSLEEQSRVVGELVSALALVVEAGSGGGADPLGAAGFSEDFDGFGVRCGGGFELEPVGRREEVVRLPGLLERDGTEE